MDRRPKSSKGKAEPKRAPARTPPKNDGARVRDLEKRLAEGPRAADGQATGTYAALMSPRYWWPQGEGSFGGVLPPSAPSPSPARPRRSKECRGLGCVS